MDVNCIAVAWSGGRDSTALLHATLAAAKPIGLRVVALHVHHGLSPNADAWLAHCEQQCERWAKCGHDVSLQSTRLTGRPARGDSIEAWARKARYQALRRMAVEQGAGVVLLAQHRLDQAETVLLQALRGAGVAGLSGMPRRIERDGITWERPWLDRSPEAIAAYVRLHRLVHVDDESNHDPRYARSRLRIDVWPALSQAFPEAEATLADAATWAQQATACLSELAALDLATLIDARGLKLPRLFALSPPRRDNALRQWLHGVLGRPAPASLMMRLVEELPRASSAGWPTDGGELRAYRGRLTWIASAESLLTEAARETTLSVRRAGRHSLPGWGGALQVERVSANGVPLAWMAHVDLRERSGGEQFQAGIGRPPRSLKKQFQAQGVPAWERDGPLLYSGGQLVFVPGLGIDARVIGLPGQPQVRLTWLAAAAQPGEDRSPG